MTSPGAQATYTVAGWKTVSIYATGQFVPSWGFITRGVQAPACAEFVSAPPAGGGTESCTTIQIGVGVVTVPVQGEQIYFTINTVGAQVFLFLQR